jgi:hypothetical protein
MGCSPHAGDQISEASKAHIRGTEKGLLALHPDDTLNDPDFHIFYHAPVLIISPASELARWGEHPMGLFSFQCMIGQLLLKTF